MDFVKLGGPYTTLYQPTDLIEGYTSLIWTERFQTLGEFELKTYDVDATKKALPEGTFVSHLETQETMMVETHSIAMVGEGADAVPELTIKGRSASSILEHRFVEADYQKKRRMRKRYSGTAAAGVLIYNAIDNASGYDLTRGDDDPETKGVINSYPWTTKDVIPNVVVSEVVSAEGEGRWWQLEQGMLYPQLMAILEGQDLGLRCYRPIIPNRVVVFTVKSALAERGTVVRTATNNVGALRFEIYSGIDRSSSVQFSLLQGHVKDPQYLESVQDYKSALEVMSGAVEVSDVYLPGETNLTGWKRKVIEFDAGTPEIPPEPEKPAELKKNATKAQREARADAMDEWIEDHAKWKNKRARIVADFREEQTKKALQVLRQRRRVDMFAGDISELSPYVFKKHYNLGDTVLLVGDYGKKAKMVVSEYVRTEDADGDRGFPGLVAP